MKNFQKFHISVKGIIRVKSEFLILTLPQEPYVDLPGGRIDEGELIRDVLIRELKEEIGLDLKIDEIETLKVLQRYEYPFFKTEKICICEILNLIELDEKPEIKLSAEHSNYYWIDKHTDLEKFMYKNAEYKKTLIKLQYNYC